MPTFIPTILPFLFLLTLTTITLSAPYCGKFCKTVPFFTENTFKLIPEVSDDFRGYPSPDKWAVRDPTRPKTGQSSWNGRQPSLFNRGNVVGRRNTMTLLARGYFNETFRAQRIFGRSNPPTSFNPNPKTFWQDNYWGYTTAFIEAKTAVKYGYFEARLRPMKTQIVNAFWLSSDTPDEWTEIDVVETAYVSAEENKFGVDHRFRVNPNLHTFRSTARKQGLCDGCDGKVFSARPTTYTNKAPLADAFHTYGLAWTKEAITFYFDGEPYVQVDNDGRWDQALFLKFDVETNFAWQGVLPDIATMGVPRFDVQWVRSYSFESKTPLTTRRTASTNPSATTSSRQIREPRIPVPEKLKAVLDMPDPLKGMFGKIDVNPVVVPGSDIEEKQEDPSALQRAAYPGETILKQVTPPKGMTWREVMDETKEKRKRRRR